MASPVRWPCEAIWEAVAPVLPGFTVEVLPQVDSTNTELMRRARSGRLEPVLLVAEQQTAGRGRLGRQWLSGGSAAHAVASVKGQGFAAGPPQGETAPSGGSAAHAVASVKGQGFAAGPPQGETAPSGGSAAHAVASVKGQGFAAGPPQGETAPSGGSAAHAVASVGAMSSLTFSLGLTLAPVDWSGLSLAVGLSVAQSLHSDIRLKWPNDLWWHDRKLAGILIETANLADVGAGRYVVIGVGLNIQTPAAQGLSTEPVGLVELLPGVDAAQALGRMAAPLLRTVQAFEACGFAPFQAAFNACDALARVPVTLSDGLQGVAQGVDATGALLVHTAQGVQRVTSSEVSVRLQSGPGYVHL